MVLFICPIGYDVQTKGLRHFLLLKAFPPTPNLSFEAPFLNLGHGSIPGPFGPFKGHIICNNVEVGKLSKSKYGIPQRGTREKADAFVLAFLQYNSKEDDVIVDLDISTCVMFHDHLFLSHLISFATIVCETQVLLIF